MNTYTLGKVLKKNHIKEINLKLDSEGQQMYYPKILHLGEKMEEIELRKAHEILRETVDPQDLLGDSTSGIPGIFNN